METGVIRAGPFEVNDRDREIIEMIDECKARLDQAVASMGRYLLERKRARRRTGVFSFLCREAIESTRF